MGNGAASEEEEPVDEPVGDANPPRAHYLQRWPDADVGWPSLVALLVAMTALALGGASIGGWGGVAVIVATLIAVIGLLYVWSAIRRR